MNQQTIPAVDLDLYESNRRLLTAAELQPFAGQWVAISGDGTRVLASGPSVEDLARELQQRSIEGAAVVWERLPDPTEDAWL